MKPKAPPTSPDKKETVVTVIPHQHQGPQVNLISDSYHDAKLKRTKVCACASVLIAIIIVAGVLGSIALWKIRFPYQDEYRHRYRPSVHKYPLPHNTGDDGYHGHHSGNVVMPKPTGGVEPEDKLPDILRATSELPSSGTRDDTISIDDGSEKDQLNTVSPPTLEVHTVSKGITDSDVTTTGTSNEQPSKSTSDSFGSFDNSFNYQWESWNGPSSSSSVEESGSFYEYVVSLSSDEKKSKQIIPWKPDYESESASWSVDKNPLPEGSGFDFNSQFDKSGSGDREGSGFDDMEFSGDTEGSGDYDSIDLDLYLPDVFFDTQQFPMIENEYSSSVTEISNVLKDPKQEYEFWKYIYDQSDVLVEYIEGAKQKLNRQELPLNVVNPNLPSIQLVRTPGPEDKFRGKCYNLVCTMKSIADSQNMKWALTGYAREGVRLVHASGNKGEVQITLRRQPVNPTTMVHFNSYLLLQFEDSCFISQMESGLPSLPNQRTDFPIVETFQSTAQVYTASSSEFCEGLPVYWVRKVNGFHLDKGDPSAPGASIARRKDILMPCCHCDEDPCICSCDIL